MRPGFGRNLSLSALLNPVVSDRRRRVEADCNILICEVG